MRSNFRLRKFLAGGSSLTEAHFADGGALEEVDYPASTSYVELKNLDKLTNEKCNTEACAPNVMSYFVSGCDNLQPIKMLIDIMDAQVGQVPHALRYVRCVGFNETFTDGRAFDKLSQLVDGTYQGIDAEGQYGNDPYPVLDGTINLTTGAYRDTYDALMTHYPKLKLNIAKWWIRFEDPEVKRICVENWDKDGDGELSMEEAADVSSIGTVFANRTIKGFTELQYFSSLRKEVKPFGEKGAFERSIFGTISLPEGLTMVPNSMFRYSQGECVIIPSSVIAIDELSFNSAKIKNLVLNGSNYIDIIRYWGLLFARIDTLYVAPHLVEKYKQSTKWNSQDMQGYLGQIRPLSEYHP